MNRYFPAYWENGRDVGHKKFPFFADRFSVTLSVTSSKCPGAKSAEADSFQMMQAKKGYEAANLIPVTSKPMNPKTQNKACASSGLFNLLTKIQMKLS